MVVLEHEFTFGVRLSLVFIVQSSFLSIIAVSVLLGFVIFNAIRNIYRPPSQRLHVVRNPLDYLFLSLLFWDLILALGAAMNILWINQGGIFLGGYCTSQGVIKQIGAVGVAFSSLAIAIYTFLVIFMRLQIPNNKRIPLTVIGLISLFLLLIPVIATRINTNPPYYGPSTYWCWIAPQYQAERLGLEYGLMWFISVLSIYLYVLLFLVLRGNIQVDVERNSRRFRLSLSKVPVANVGDRDQRESINIAKEMLAYPIVYIILIAPMSIIRWVEPTRSKENPLPCEWTAIAGCIYSSSGLVNVFLYLTRPRLLESWDFCRRRRRRRRDSLSTHQSTGNIIQNAQPDTAPEMAMNTSATVTRLGSGDQPRHQPPPNMPIVPAIRLPTMGGPRLDDDSSDEDVPIASEDPSSPASRSTDAGGVQGGGTRPNGLTVPQPLYKNSWSSDGTKVGSHSRDGSGYGDNLEYR
ncbi:hypothetical protein FRC03_001797 [Tulasnella sp. 419]|nr:hypothetical protein FRC03_001797 [Tulasnella sp. 419]